MQTEYGNEPCNASASTPAGLEVFAARCGLCAEDWRSDSACVPRRDQCEIMRDLPELGVITFRLSGHLMALPLEAVQEVVRNESLTRLPAAPAYVAGILPKRERVVPVVRLRELLSLNCSRDRERFIVICQYEGLQMGIMMDSIVAMRQVAGRDLDFNIADRLGGLARYVSALVRCGGELISLLSIHGLMGGMIEKEGLAHA
ncbi:purine-binding chemotaxis protein CheW [Paucidesulfovibrio gracilis DSM 16080]|uniref:Purine-binding chemotaxis protein CheW n=1 Tax=Paucidesulfovibrio gracilis DSM 16080 TaxID=1121449 RepID=A0A1T4XXA7_9BACT|nr:chemotaxis protein CheW [Paucidesulfovibrio gracilis]SKA94166.1 purine-binding chemotaxis protein CheW [Paucidesulfovibrio gracilis DSM 16080]